LIYTLVVTRRTTLEVDDALLERAQEALGTSGLKDTVDKAFEEAIRRHLRDRLARRIESGHGVDRSRQALEKSRPRR
jgi:Arc/MetJ family transcription regulator